MAPVFKLFLISYASHLDHVIQDENLEINLHAVSVGRTPQSVSAAVVVLACDLQGAGGAEALYYSYSRRVKALLCRVQTLKTALKQDGSRTWLAFSVVVGQLALDPHKGVRKLVPCACRSLHSVATLRILALLCPV